MAKKLPKTKHVGAGFEAGFEAGLNSGVKQYDKEGDFFLSSKRNKKQVARHKKHYCSCSALYKVRPQCTNVIAN